MEIQFIHQLTKPRTFLGFGLFAVAVIFTGCGKQDAQTTSDPTESQLLASVAHLHDQSGETCFICDASKRDKGRLWCKEHDRYEDRCWLCHPELESGETSEENYDHSEHSQDTSAVLFCNEHNLPEIECGICQPDLAASLQLGGNLKVRFLSEKSADKAGIRTDRPRMTEDAPIITAFGETQYNLNALAKVTPLAGGIVRKVHYDIGEIVAAGEPLAELHSAEVASAKSEYLTAMVKSHIRFQSFEREKRLKEQSITAEKDLLEAEAAYRTARLEVGNLRQKLINLGLIEEEIAQIERDQDTSANLVVRAPFAGTLIERGSVIGEAVESGHALFTVADLSTRWLELSIPSDHVGRIQIGQLVEAEFPEIPGVAISGRINWIDTSVDPRTRMVRARALVTESAERLTTGLFGKIAIAIGETRSAAMLPRGAVQRHEGRDFVFVRDTPDLFVLRRVELGNSSNGQVQVIAGLQATDSVVTDGSFIVMSEFLKSRLGAGCVDE